MRATVVVNATGVWADDVRALDEAAHPHSLRPAKGVHVTVPADPAPLRHRRRDPGAQQTGGRSSWCPGPRPGWSTSGPPTPTTTGRSTTRPAPPRTSTTCSEAVNAVTTSDARPGHDVTGVWAGLRPLLAPPPERPAPSERTADLSRRHTVRTSAARRGHGDRRQADHLPQDGRGHHDAGGAHARPDGCGGHAVRHQAAAPAGRPTTGDRRTDRRPDRHSTGRSVRTALAEHLAARYGTEAGCRAGRGRGSARAARTGRRGSALPRGRDRLRRPGRDGPVPRRRAGPAHPGRPQRRPPAARPPPARWPSCWPPSWAGAPSRRPSRRRPSPRAAAGRARARPDSPPPGSAHRSGR